MEQKRHIRNSTAEFLIFAAQNAADTIEVRLGDETLWLTQQLMAQLFETSRTNIIEHIRNIYSDGELSEDATCRNFRQIRREGTRTVNREQPFYNLDMIIAVGYRVNSRRATQFRQWSTSVLRDYALRGYVIDRKRMENGRFLGQDYFEHLLAEIREIRMSERRFYQKITDIYATSMDYDPAAPETLDFFAKVQNKLHYAVHGHTAAELIAERADAAREHMGLTSWENAPDGKIVKTDVTVAKNYLRENELEALGRIVGAYLELAENRAKRQIPMTMRIGHGIWTAFSKRTTWRSCKTQAVFRRRSPEHMRKTNSPNSASFRIACSNPISTGKWSYSTEEKTSENFRSPKQKIHGQSHIFHLLKILYYPSFFS